MRKKEIDKDLNVKLCNKFDYNLSAPKCKSVRDRWTQMSPSLLVHDIAKKPNQLIVKTITRILKLGYMAKATNFEEAIKKGIDQFIIMQEKYYEVLEIGKGIISNSNVFNQ